ncbi:hypothetical protein [Phenylobacterium sp.]|jgi:hypothetical protein|uniref:hypothetical protein n=1 Tax=Phenylobacterium sp. TaxID=1871053 RepID=UPI0025F1E23C|nr:hypothetical protein [Phenylobacterium sp.]MCA3721192.1 hypothetical protein [Phenylobacterium sp.]
MSLDLDADPGPAGLAEAGAGLSPADGAEEIDLSAPLEALPAQAFSLSDEVRFHPARSLGAALLAGIALGLLIGRSLQTLRSLRSSS